MRGPVGKVGEKQKRTPKINVKKQPEQFKEAARELEAEESSDAFECIVKEMKKPEKGESDEQGGAE